MKKSTLIRNTVLAVATLTVLTACGNDKSKALVTVNGVKITQEKMDKRIQSLPENTRASFAATENRKLLLDQLVNEELILQEAKKQKLDQKPEYKEQIATLEEQLQNSKNQLLINMILKDNIEKNIAVTEQDVSQFYENNKAQFQGYEQRRARHILVATEAEAKKILAELKSGKNFEALAKEKSMDPTKANGGDLGFFKRGDLVPDFEKVAFALKKGEVSGIVKTQFGYHVMRLEDIQIAPEKPFESVKGQIQQFLQNQKQGAAINTYLDGLKAKAKIKKADEKEDEKKEESKENH